MATAAVEPLPPRAVVRRGGWALPPEPPETWVGTGWGLALLGALVLAVVVPVSALLRDGAEASAWLVALHAAAATAALLTGYLLLVQRSVTGDLRLRWLAAGYAVLALVVLARSLQVLGPLPDDGRDPQELGRGAVLGLLWSLAVPVAVLSAGLARRSPRLLVVPAVALLVPGALMLVLPTPADRLVTAGGADTLALDAAALTAALVAAAAAVRWWRQCPLPWTRPWVWVLAGLVPAPLVGLLRVASERRYDDLWWASVGAEVLCLAVPAIGLLAHGAGGYFRQARRWRQLEEEVRRLRTTTALLPGRSVTPEDEAGFPNEEEVREVIEQRRLRIALQPVVELRTGAVVGHEALARFGGRTPTDRWFKAANRYGLGGRLEQVALAIALDLLPRLDPPTFLAVNVSPAALTDPRILELLQGSDLRRIVVEVTEHEAVADYPLARAALDRLRAGGARVAVDDTGAGFASLRHVLLLQPDVIKLDTSITRDVEKDSRQQHLVGALNRFAGEVGSEVLAEGVETEEQRQSLIEIGVPIGQGWHLGLPIIQD